MSDQAVVRPAEPVIREIGVSDIVDAVASGLRDFRAAPIFGLFFGGIYAVGGMLVVLTAYALDMSYLSYPLAVGFVLVGPFIAVGLYEISRRREAGAPLTWSAVLGVIMVQRKRELGWMAFVCLFVFLMWMYQVRILIALFFGLNAPATLDAFLTMLVGTPEGLMFLLVGHGVGALLSLVLFSITVVSFPLLLDRELDFITAMIASVRAVTRNPKPMIGWALVVVVLLIVAMAPMFIGLFLALPILGHATWHLYRKLIEPV